jgi:hypothetical protein
VPPIAPPVSVEEPQLVLGNPLVLNGVPLFLGGRVRCDYIDATIEKDKAQLAVISNLTAELDKCRQGQRDLRRTSDADIKRRVVVLEKNLLELVPGPLAYYSNFIKSRKVPVKSRKFDLRF